MDKSDFLYPSMLETIENYQISLKQVTCERDSIENGLLIFKPEGYPEGQHCIYRIKNSVETLITEYDGSYYLLIELLLQTYSNLTVTPEIIPDNSSGFTIHDQRMRIELITEPIPNYSSYLERLKKATTLLKDWNLKYGGFIDYFENETFDGTESIKEGVETITGKRPDFNHPGYRIVKLVDDEVWDVFYKDRSSRIFEVRIHDEEVLYRFLLDQYISVMY